MNPLAILTLLSNLMTQIMGMEQQIIAVTAERDAAVANAKSEAQTTETS